MTLETAKRQAQLMANESGMPAIVYKSWYNLEIAEENRYGYCFTLPAFGIRVGEPIRPENETNLCRTH